MKKIYAATIYLKSGNKIKIHCSDFVLTHKSNEIMAYRAVGKNTAELHYLHIDSIESIIMHSSYFPVLRKLFF